MKKLIRSTAVGVAAVLPRDTDTDTSSAAAPSSCIAPRSLLIALACLSPLLFASAAEITRHPLPGGSTLPIARAVEVPPGYTIVFLSGQTPSPLDPKARRGSVAYWGDTKAQTLSVFERIEESLAHLHLDFGDVVAMTVFLAGDPAKQGKMDFEGFMDAYRQFFGTTAQPNLPARSTVQVAGLVQPGMLVEIEVRIARKSI
jgi:enamine deaminase RidA (YjgF/YER057c/UK114 family)